MSIREMFKDQAKKGNIGIKMGVTSYYNQIIKGSGKRYKMPKIRFGKIRGDHYRKARIITTALIWKAIQKKSQVLFYDESTICSSSFSKKM